jgi:hypothetical protein
MGSNHVVVRHRSSSNYGNMVDAVLTQNGESIYCGAVIPISRIYELRIVYVQQSINILVRDDGQEWTTLGATRAWTSSVPASVSVSAANGTAGYKFSTQLMSFTSKLNVLYGAEPATDAIITVYGISTKVPDPRWVRHEVKPVTIALFDHIGVRDTGQFTYDRTGYYRVKQSPGVTVDLITAANKPAKKALPAPPDSIGLPFSLPFGL